MASAASPANKNSNLRLWKAEHCEIAELKENELFGVRNVEGQSQQFGDFEMGADKLAAIELIDHIMDMCQPNQTIELVSGDPETLAVMYLRARFHENYNEGMIEIKDEVLAQVVDHKDKIEKNKECLNFINDKKFNPAEEIKNNQKDEASNKHQENGENENHPRPPRS